MSRQWLVRRSAWPWSALGAPLGIVVARDCESADAVASCRYARPYTVEPYRGVVVCESPAVAKRVERRKPCVNAQLFGRGTTKRSRTGEV